MKKRGNDGKYYISQPNKNGIFRWEPINNAKNPSQKATRKDLQILVNKYCVTKSGTNSEIAQRLINLRNHVIKNKKDRMIIQQFL